MLGTSQTHRSIPQVANHVVVIFITTLFVSLSLGADDGQDPGPCVQDCDCFLGVVQDAEESGLDPNDLMNVCNYNYCQIESGSNEGICTSCPSTYGDSCPGLGGLVGTRDILCAVIGFGDYCACPNADVFDNQATGCGGYVSTACKGPSGPPIRIDDILSMVILPSLAANPTDCPGLVSGCNEAEITPAPACGMLLSDMPLVPSAPIPGPHHTTTLQSSVASFSIQPRQRAVHAGHHVQVDVFVSGAASLMAYELGVAVRPGRSGSSRLVSAAIDTDRRDYIFSGMNCLPLTDSTIGRIGGVLLEGSVDTVSTNRAYLGTLTFATSPNARGVFNFAAMTKFTALLCEHGRLATSEITESAILVVPASVGHKSKP